MKPNHLNTITKPIITRFSPDFNLQLLIFNPFIWHMIIFRYLFEGQKLFHLLAAKEVLECKCDCCDDSKSAEGLPLQKEHISLNYIQT